MSLREEIEALKVEAEARVHDENRDRESASFHKGKAMGLQMALTVIARHPEEPLRAALPENGQALVFEITRAVRAADEAFEKSGGSSRHWVQDWFIPYLEDEGLMVVRRAALTAPAAPVEGKGKRPQDHAGWNPNEGKPWVK